MSLVKQQLKDLQDGLERVRETAERSRETLEHHEKRLDSLLSRQRETESTVERMNKLLMDMQIDVHRMEKKLDANIFEVGSKFDLLLKQQNEMLVMLRAR